MLLYTWMETLALPQQANSADQGGSPEFTVRLASNEEINGRWPEVEAALTSAFTDAAYSGDHKENKHNGTDLPPDDPVAHTRAGAEGRLRDGLMHALAEDGQGRIIGGIFCIPTERNPEETDGNMGWVFTSGDVSPRSRLPITDSLVSKAYETAIEDAGFERIVVAMGTMAGARMFARQYGFKPDGDVPGRWIGTADSYKASRGGRRAA